MSTGKLRYVALDMPLERIHPLAFKAAEATHCANEQGKYWEMHARLFQNQRALQPWSGHAEAIGLNVAEFDACMNSDKFAPLVRKSMAQAEKIQVSGTPSFVLGLTDPKDPTKIKGVSFLRGAQPFARFKATIDAALGEKP